MGTRIRTWHPRERREEALALHNAGLGYGRIAQRMELPLNTVKSWIRRYGPGLDEVYATPCVEEASGEQISEQVEYIPLEEMEEHRVFLVCGSYDFRGKIDGFLTKIPEMLAQNVTVGDVFVFCNRSRYQISALQWQGDGFAIMFKRTEGERYPWPVSVQVKVIEISRNDLQTLLEYPRFIRRLSGQATPENYL
jgi:transposase